MHPAGAAGVVLLCCATCMERQRGTTSCMRPAPPEGLPGAEALHAPPQVLVEAIGSAAALGELHLGRCALSPRSAPAVEDLLRTAPALESLQLCWNHLGTKGACPLPSMSLANAVDWLGTCCVSRYTCSDW